MKRIPPHIAWPLFIIGFLALGITWSIGIVVASQSDGGPAVIEDYYQKAISWDQEAERRALNDAQQWQISLSIERATVPHILSVQIEDANGIPMHGLNGTISAQRPQDSKPVVEATLDAAASMPGTYTATISDLTRGLWDFHIDAEKDSFVVYTTIRKEF